MIVFGLALLGVLIFFLVKFKSNKYDEVFDSTTSKNSGSCVAGDDKGTPAGMGKTGDLCEEECDLHKSCQGYEWDGVACTLYETTPTSANPDTKTHCYKKD